MRRYVRTSRRPETDTANCASILPLTQGASGTPVPRRYSRARCSMILNYMLKRPCPTSGPRMDVPASGLKRLTSLFSRGRRNTYPTRALKDSITHAIGFWSNACIVNSSHLVATTTVTGVDRRSSRFPSAKASVFLSHGNLKNTGLVPMNGGHNRAYIDVLTDVMSSPLHREHVSLLSKK